MSSLRLCLAGLAVAILAAVWIAFGSAGEPVDGLPAPDGNACEIDGGSPVAPGSPVAGSRTAVADPVSTAGTAIEAAGPSPDLAGLLVAVARAERERRLTDLEAHVLEVLAPPFGVPAVLRALEDGGIAAQGDAPDGVGPGPEARSGGTGPSDMLRGAVTTLALAAARDRAHGRDEVVLEILAGLPLQVEPARSRLAPLLASLVVEGRPVIGAHLWPRLLELQRAHAKLAEDLAPLFANLHQDREALDAQVPVLVEAAGLVEFPSVVVAAARCLWALDPDLGAAVVAGVRSRDDLSPELLSELAQFAARYLEPRAAVESLGGESTSVALAGMLVFAERQEAAEVLRTKYSELVIDGGDERQRKNIVFGMRREDTRVLLGIAESDPSPRVREQALLTLTSTRPLDAPSVQSLRALRTAGAASISAHACVTAAGNVIVKSSGRARAEALELLRELSQDPAVGAADRQQALALIEKHSPTHEEASEPQAGK